VKTSAALATTSIVGLGLATLGAMPAQAADVTTPCENVYDHNPGGTTVSDNWYMECVPQYGLGKVEFTVDSEVDFPAGFASLDDPSVTSVSANTGPAASEYMDSTFPVAGFTYLGETDAQAQQLTYQGLMMFAISGVSAMDVSALPDGCGAGPYAYAFRVDYLPATVTFTQTIDGKVWTVVVTYTPSPLYLGLNFTDDDPIDFDDGAVQCASSDTGTLVGQPDDFSQTVVLGPHASHFPSSDVIGSLSPFPNADPDDDPIGVLGSFAATTPKPELAATGVETGGLGLVGGLSILVGSMLALFWRRRRRGEQV
jgi:LPXTG-motif cell wall-anchored protein